jgi:hypothetical protein
VNILQRSLGSSTTQSPYLRAVLSLGNGSAGRDENSFWKQVFGLLEDDFGFSSANIYVQEEPGNFTRRSALSLSVGVVTRIENAALPPLVSAVLSQQSTVFVDRTSLATQRAWLTAPARRGIALPLWSEDRLIAIIEAVSDIDAAFSAEMREWLALFGEQITRWYVAVRQQRALVERLAEANTMLRRLTRQAEAREEQSLETLKSEWNTYLQRRGNIIGYDLEVGAQEQLLRADGLPAEVRAAMERGQAIVETHDGRETLSVPIIVRGTLLGAMAFTLPIGRHLTERQNELARGVAERLGTSLESTRLFEQTHTLAQRERQANESTARLQGIVDVQTIINLAAADFREVLGAVYTNITLDLKTPVQEAG